MLEQTIMALIYRLNRPYNQPGQDGQLGESDARSASGRRLPLRTSAQFPRFRRPAAESRSSLGAVGITHGFIACPGVGVSVPTIPAGRALIAASCTRSA
jgi:hypothetical protein